VLMHVPHVVYVYNIFTPVGYQNTSGHHLT